MIQGYLSVTEASELSGYSAGHIQKLVKQGDIKGQKISHTWAIDRQSLLDYQPKPTKGKGIRLVGSGESEREKNRKKLDEIIAKAKKPIYLKGAWG